MATYEVTSSEVFLRCSSVGVVEVYRLDNLYVAPVKEKYWSHLETTQIGVGKQYDVLKIGNKNIKGHRLIAVMKDLLDSRLMVNREGLCYLPMIGVSSDVGAHKVDYYRVFDRFDWAHYGVKSSLTTKWVCTDVLLGRPLALHFSDEDDEDDENDGDDDDDDERLIQKEKELVEIKRKNKELEEIVAKKQEDIEELNKKLKQVTPTDISTGHQSYTRDRNDNDVIKTVDELYLSLISSFVGQVTSIYPYERRKPDKTDKLYQFRHIDVIPTAIPFENSYRPGWSPDVHIAMTSEIDVDKDGWKVLNAVLGFPISSPTNLLRYTIMFYDGKYEEIQVCGANVPFPIAVEDMKSAYFPNHWVFDIAGFGPRFVILEHVL